MLNRTRLDDLVLRVRGRRLPPAAQRREIRQSAGVSLREAADAIGVDPMTLWRWERGATPRPRHAEHYRAFLDAIAEVADDS